MIKLTDDSTIEFKKEKNRFLIKIAAKEKVITLHLNKEVLRLLSMEIDDLLN